MLLVTKEECTTSLSHFLCCGIHLLEDDYQAISEASSQRVIGEHGKSCNICLSKAPGSPRNVRFLTTEQRLPSLPADLQPQNRNGALGVSYEEQDLLG